MSTSSGSGSKRNRLNLTLPSSAIQSSDSGSLSGRKPEEIGSNSDLLHSSSDNASESLMKRNGNSTGTVNTTLDKLNDGNVIISSENYSQNSQQTTIYRPSAHHSHPHSAHRRIPPPLTDLRLSPKKTHAPTGGNLFNSKVDRNNENRYSNRISTGPVDVAEV
ncbi:unnamed protein product [Trichobilharzia regenti]|nr:unnamed protein product [Trichobilharzia regenti]